MILRYPRGGAALLGSPLLVRPFPLDLVRIAGLSKTAMRELLYAMRGRAVTVHGFRSAFSDWAHEQTNAKSEVVEMALAHAVGSDVERAYRRTKLFEEVWANYLSAKPIEVVVPFTPREGVSQ